MALTEEQIKSLKKGDPIVIPCKFLSVDNEGDIWTAVDGCELWFSPSCVSLPSEHGTSVPTPKHDPCRLFREGDEVEPKQVKGRVYSKDSKHLIGKKCIVFRDEEEPGYVVISYAGKNYSINAAYLQLVTPMEELEPYKLIDSPNTYNIVCDSATVMTIHKKSHPNAKAAAEAEAARLNAEWRKEQK